MTYKGKVLEQVQKEIMLIINGLNDLDTRTNYDDEEISVIIGKLYEIKSLVAIKLRSEQI